ncbi:hypothetical protein GKZ90_0024400 [Flavobacterium sp. MC2016-06]|uniref:hypothetical protein n=1 Tax=Flavobacterium sp. MC2016-06 TaxID=2676308 RepID=UPI0012BB1778|nr:hypothetical protein [Flavobacterium sp. MC2016-06]
MKERIKRKKIFYVPGMISLVLIPLFCFCHFYKVDAFKVYGGMDLAMPPSDQNYFEEYKFKTLRKYKEFDFDVSELGNKRLIEMQFYLRRLKMNRDTINGVKIHLGSKTRYETFISSIDIISLEDAPTWIIDDNDIYVLASSNTYKKTKNEVAGHAMNCNTGEMMRQQAYWEQKNKKEEEERIFQISFFKQKWMLLSLGYFGIVLLNIFTLVKFNKNR